METTLKNAPRFLIAKYAPDMRRMEPRNIGVIVWSSGHVSARFAGESGDPLTHETPPFVANKNKAIYLQWVRHWRSRLKKGTIPGRGAKKVTVESPDFLDAFRRLGRENYFLADGGFLLDEVRPNQMQDVVDDLYDKLVAYTGETQQEQAFRQLNRGWRTVLGKTGIKNRSDFKHHYSIQCRIEGISREFKWDSGVGNGVPAALFQRTHVRRDESVNSTYLMLEAVTSTEHIVESKRCAAIIHATLDELAEPSISSAVAMLQLHGKVLNVAVEDQAIEVVRSMDIPPPHDAAPSGVPDSEGP